MKTTSPCFIAAAFLLTSIRYDVELHRAVVAVDAEQRALAEELQVAGREVAPCRVHVVDVPTGGRVGRAQAPTTEHGVRRPGHRGQRPGGRTGQPDPGVGAGVEVVVTGP